MAGLLAAIDLAPAGRYERARELAARCRELLAERVDVVTEPGHSTLVTWRDEQATDRVGQALEAGVVIRELPKLGWLRASVGWWNDESDLERLVAAVT
jgi:L-cysteine/cystine lyase